MLTRGAWAVAALGGEDVACQAAGATEQRLPPTLRHRMRTATSSGRLRPDLATLPPGSPLPGRSGLAERGHGCAHSPPRLRPRPADTASTWSPACVHPDASASGPPPETMPTSSPPVCNPPTHSAPAVKAAEQVGKASRLSPTRMERTWKGDNYHNPEKHTQADETHTSINQVWNSQK